MNLPSGAGAPAADGAAAIADALTTCRQVSSFVAEAAVSGSAAGRRVRARLHMGVAAPTSARLEAVAPFGQPLFILVARSGRATLLLTRPDRVLEHDDPAEVLEALTGVPLDPAALRIALTGCAVQPSEGQVRQVDDDWRVVPDGTTAIYLRRQSRDGPWRLVAASHRPAGRAAWRVEYRDFLNGLPRSLRFASSEPDRFDLRMELSQVEINTPLDAAAFEVNIPAASEPLTIEELRRSGPLSAAAVVEDRDAASAP
jgi:outer membrane biogenesis lipoprotein LolB